MKRATTIAIVFAAAATVAVAAAGPAAARDRCAVAGTETLRSTPLVRVYLDDNLGSAVACSRASGRRTLLYEDDGYLSQGTIGGVAGRFVSYAWSSIPACKAACPPDVVGSSATEVANAATGRIRRLEAFVVARVVLAPSGAAAWLSPPAPGLGGRTLSLWDAAGRRRLDQGQIAPASVRRRGGRLRWTNGTRARSVPMP